MPQAATNPLGVSYEAAVSQRKTANTASSDGPSRKTADPQGLAQSRYGPTVAPRRAATPEAVPRRNPPESRAKLQRRDGTSPCKRFQRRARQDAANGGTVVTRRGGFSLPKQLFLPQTDHHTALSIDLSLPKTKSLRISCLLGIPSHGIYPEGPLSFHPPCR